MKIKRLLIFLALFCFAQTKAQNRDSIRNVSNDLTQPDTMRLKAMYKLAWSYIFEIPDSSLAISEKLYSFALECNSKKYQAQALKIITKALYFKGNFPLALEYTFKNLKVNEEIKDKRGIADSYNMLGNINHMQGESEKALEFHRKSLKIKQEINYREGIAGTYNNIGNVYLQDGKKEEALDNFLKGLKVFEELGQPHNIAGANINIAEVYASMGNTEKAMEHYTITKKIAEEIKENNLMSNVLAGIGLIYLKQGDLNKAKSFCEEGYKMASEMNVLGQIEANCDCLYKVYSQLGDFRKAFQYHQEFIASRDSLRNEDRSREITSKMFQFTYEKKAAADSVRNADLQKVKDTQQQAELKQEATQRYALYVILVLVGIFAVFMFNRFKFSQKQNKIIESQKAEVENQKHIIEEKNKEVMDSIHYAKRIQQTLLAGDVMLKSNLAEYFIFFQPKDIVSGDFYWSTVVQSSLNNLKIDRSDPATLNNFKPSLNHEHFYFAVCDSTGHGVPGAFMSLLNISFLNEAINEKILRQPNDILDHVRKRLIESLHSDNNDQGSKDGMDCSLLCFEKEGNKTMLHFSCANNPLIFIRDGKLIDFSFDRMSVGQSPKEDQPFTMNSIELQKGDVIYAFTDGYSDQFGGAKGKKFKYKKLVETLQANASLNMQQQKEIFASTFNEWKGNLEQLDDVLLVGIKV
ncbi:MAG: protein serine/threonine phosphatase [Bacteroidetes bacterium]|jgi:serine phosphatase RsbU (regulator of sigma subunit)|nr:protein serine/threonine phosphatase [Bacteroidota bacterium]